MIIFIIPAYNEEENIELLLSNLDSKMKNLRLRYYVLFVNDGSTDATRKKALTFQGRIPLEILDHNTNKGVGQVFRTGFTRALEIAGDDDIIVTKEADNTGDLEILHGMIKKIESGYDLVLASCYASGGRIIGTTIDRLVLSFCANFIIKLFFSVNDVYTYSSFYRAYKARMLKKAFYAYSNRLIDDDGFTCMVEMLIKLNRLPIRIAEIPMVLRCDFRKGKSKMNKSATMYSYLRLIKRELKYNRNNISAVIARYMNNV